MLFSSVHAVGKDLKQMFSRLMRIAIGFGLFCLTKGALRRQMSDLQAREECVLKNLCWVLRVSGEKGASFDSS